MPAYAWFLRCPGRGGCQVPGAVDGAGDWHWALSRLRLPTTRPHPIDARPMAISVTGLRRGAARPSFQGVAPVPLLGVRPLLSSSGQRRTWRGLHRAREGDEPPLASPLVLCWPRPGFCPGFSPSDNEIFHSCGPFLH
jgi:hypothetical protein